MTDYRKRLIKFAKKNGWRISITKNNHFRLTHSETTQSVIASFSPRDGAQALRNTEKECRKALCASRSGVDMPRAVAAPRVVFPDRPKTTAAERRHRHPVARQAMLKHVPQGSYRHLDLV